MGFDLAYNRLTDLQTSSGPTTLDAPGQHLGRDQACGLIRSAQSSTKLVDYGTLRLRAGYAFGQFLPYAVVGGALGRFNYSTTVALTDCMTDVRRQHLDLQHRRHRPTPRTTPLSPASTSGSAWTWRCCRTCSCAASGNTSPLPASHGIHNYHEYRSGRPRRPLLDRAAADAADSFPRQIGLDGASALRLCPPVGHPSPTRGAYLKG